MTCLSLDALKETNLQVMGLTVEQIAIANVGSVPRHMHDGRHASFVIAGAMEDATGGVTRERGPGSAAFLGASAWHDVRIIAVPFSCIVVSLAPASEISFAATKEDVDVSRVLTEIASIAARVAHAQVPVERIAVGGAIAELLAHGRQAIMAGDVTRPPPWLGQVRTIIEHDPRVMVSAQVFARKVGVHPTHISRAFRFHYGRTMRAFARECRLARALADLDDLSLTISQVAIEHGFADHAHLTRTMRSSLGVSPSELRRAAIPTRASAAM